MKIYLYLFLIVGFFGACGTKYTPVPVSMIQPNDFTLIMMDLRLAESNQKLLHQQGQRDINLLDSSYQLVYKIHGVTAVDVEKSYNFYVMHPEWMDKITNDVIDKLNRLEH